MYSIDFRIATVVRPGGSSTDASKSWRLAIARTLIDVQSREPRDRCAGHLEVLGVHLNANARQPQSSGGGNGRARTHEGVENHAFAQGQGGPHKLRAPVRASAKSRSNLETAPEQRFGGDHRSATCGGCPELVLRTACGRGPTFPNRIAATPRLPRILH